jgi:glutamine amidotransferase
LIAIIDYGMGNLASVANAFAQLGFKAYITSEPEMVLKADRVVLPGVGAFADAMKNLRNTGMDQVIHETVKRNIPLLGVCLGLQLLFTSSEENGVHDGLDVIKGRVVRIPPLYKVPHMGWNEVKPVPSSRIFKGVPAGSYFYFIHSYYVMAEDPEWVAAVTDYGFDFTCAVERNNVFATQFHPEKSSTVGLRVLKNFGEI